MEARLGVPRATTVVELIARSRIMYILYDDLFDFVWFPRVMAIVRVVFFKKMF